MDLKALFLEWLSDMHEEEKKKAVSRGNSRLFSVYKPLLPAHDELAKYPLPLTTPRDVLIVKNIGPGILKELETRLGAHQGSNPCQIELQPNSAHSFLHEPRRVVPKKKNSAITETETADSAPQSAPKRVRKVESGTRGHAVGHAWSWYYVYGMGVYEGFEGKRGISSGFMAINLCAEQLVIANSAALPIDANPRGGRHEFIFTHVAQDSSNNTLAKSISNLSEDSSQPASQLSQASFRRQPFAPDTASNKPFGNLSFAPGEFEITPLLDTREVKNGANRSFFYDGLYHGDDEIVLEYIIERKTMDDLVSSIKDGRFKEQKVISVVRMRRPNVIYVIEEVSTESAEYFGMDAAHTAITQTQFENGFFVKKTSSAEDTLNYLVSLINALKTVYQPGMSLEKAVFFSRTFKTGAGLFKSLASCSSDTEQGAGGESRKAIGNALAKKILNLFWRSEVSTAEF
ncbi:hypothetical protein BJ741DRAFT_671412 [Chytriomyces cf. hyalinus JEL632]|nr:hypothetical protein BJ741DRAFT_671412 [Chytriomyces cf. hyalinus JEL632]